VRAYLAAVYGVQTMYIRTDNYIAPLCRGWNGAWGRDGKSFRTYKRAVVGLVEPFYCPVMQEDMSEADREAREESLGQMYHVQARKDNPALKMWSYSPSPQRCWWFLDSCACCIYLDSPHSSALRK
jgi:large subunit ribosomal protein L23